MTAAQKFMFDLTFDGAVPSPTGAADVADPEQPAEADSAEAEDEEEVEEEVQPGFNEHQMEVAKTEAFEAGRLQGMEDASKTVEHDTLNAVRAVAQTLTELFGKQEQANNTMIKDGVGVAATIARKIFPALDEASRLDEISRLVEHTLLRLIEEPRVVVRINPALMDTLGSRLDGLKAGAGYEGRIILKEDAALDLGDCRLEWGDGSAERNAAMLWQSIDTIIEDTVGIIERIIPDEVMVDVTPNAIEAFDPAQNDAPEEGSEPSPEPVPEAVSEPVPEPVIEPASEAVPELTPESPAEKPEDELEITEEPETSEQEEAQNTADSLEIDEQGMIAGDEADIVEPEQPEEEASESAEQEPEPDSELDEELNTAEDVPETDLAAPEEAAPEEAAPEEAAAEDVETSDDSSGEEAADEADT